MRHGQQVVDDLETVLTVGTVDRRHIHHQLELGILIVAQEGQDLQQ